MGEEKEKEIVVVRVGKDAKRCKFILSENIHAIICDLSKTKVSECQFSDMHSHCLFDPSVIKVFSIQETKVFLQNHFQR